MKLSWAAIKTMDLAQFRSLGSSFPSLEEMVKETKGDPEKIAELISANYGGRISAKEVREYARINNIDLSQN